MAVLLDGVSPVLLVGGLIGVLAVIALAAFALLWIIAYIRKKNQQK